MASTAAPAATITFAGNKATDGSAHSVHTLTAVPFGADDATRRIFIVVSVRGSAGPDVILSSATIGGIAATTVASKIYNAGGSTLSHAVYVLAATVPTGASGTVVLTFPNNVWVYLGSYRVTNLISITPTDTESGNLTAGTTISLTPDVQKDGILIAGAHFFSAKSMLLSVGATQDYSVLFSTTRYAVGGSLAVTATQATRTVTFSRSSTSDGLAATGTCLAVALR